MDQKEIKEDIVIIGAGLAGLNTSLGLHRLGLRSLVLESSESLRTTGFALTLWTNAWRALDAVGIGNSLRPHVVQLKGFKIASPETGVFALEQTLDKDGNFGNYEGRCVKRKELLETLESELPPGTIRFSSKVMSIEESGRFKLIHLADGCIIKTKVLIGCDGVNSVVARWLGLEKPVSVGRYAIRGLVEFPNGSGLVPMVHVNFGGGVRIGFVPVDDKTVYWFCTFNPSEIPSYEEDLEHDPIKMKQFVLSRISKMPQEAQNVVERTELSSISCAELKMRLPWNVLFGDIAKGNVCVAGDALHPMTPYIGQGGCSALEDGVMLARCVGEALLKEPREENFNEEEEFERIEKGLEKYAKERRWRSFNLISTAYVVGYIQESNGKIMTFLRRIWFSKYTANAFLRMANFDCGKLV